MSNTAHNTPASTTTTVKTGRTAAKDASQTAKPAAATSAAKDADKALPDVPYRFVLPRFPAKRSALMGSALRAFDDGSVECCGSPAGFETARALEGFGNVNNANYIWAVKVAGDRPVRIGVSCCSSILADAAAGAGLAVENSGTDTENDDDESDFDGASDEEAEENDEQPDPESPSADTDAVAAVGCVPGLTLEGLSLHSRTGEVCCKLNDDDDAPTTTSYFAPEVAKFATSFKVILSVVDKQCTVRFCADTVMGQALTFTIPERRVAFPTISLSDKGSEVIFVNLAELGQHLNPEMDQLFAAWTTKYGNGSGGSKNDNDNDDDSNGNADGNVKLVSDAFSGDFIAALKNKLQKHTANVLMTGPAGCGKSSLFGATMCLCNGEELDVMPRSTNHLTTEGGQWSTTYLLEKCSRYFPAGTWDPSTCGDIQPMDGPGYTGREDELRTACCGKLRTSEEFSRNKTSEKRDAILQRAEDPSRRVCCIVLCISARQLLAKHDNIDKYVKGILQLAKELYVDNKTGATIEVPVILVITQCDRMEPGPEPVDLLLQDNSPYLKHVFTCCHQRFGIAYNTMIAAGWLDQTYDIDFSLATKDPRALVLRHLMLTIAGAGELFARSWEERLAEEKKSAGVFPDFTAFPIALPKHIDQSCLAPPPPRSAVFQDPHTDAHFENEGPSNSQCPLGPSSESDDDNDDVDDEMDARSVRTAAHGASASSGLVQKVADVELREEVLRMQRQVMQLQEEHSAVLRSAIAQQQNERR